MSLQQWRDELAIVVSGTSWFVDCCGALEVTPRCVADLQNRLSKKSVHIELSADVFRTPEARNDEVLRQLAR